MCPPPGIPLCHVNAIFSCRKDPSLGKRVVHHPPLCTLPLSLPWRVLPLATLPQAETRVRGNFLEWVQKGKCVAFPKSRVNSSTLLPPTPGL